MPNGVREKHIAELDALMPSARAGVLRPKNRRGPDGKITFDQREHALATIALVLADLERDEDDPSRPKGGPA